MKISGIFVLLAAMVMAVCALPFHDRPSRPRQNPSFPGYPTFPGTPPFNPRPQGGLRFRRSPQVSLTVDQPINGRPSVAIDGEHEVYRGENGRVSVYGSGSMTEGRHPVGNGGIRGEFHWD